MPGLLHLFLLTCCLQLLWGAPASTPRPSQGNQHSEDSQMSVRPQPYKNITNGGESDVFPSQDNFPKEDSTFILDLQNLSKANLTSENPNIQVTIEVDPSSQTEVELDLSDTRTDWNDPDWASQHELFWPLFWEYSDFPNGKLSTPGTVGPDTADYSQYDWEDNILSGGDANTHGTPGDNWISEDKYHYDYDEDEWSHWTPCSATCGRPSQKRTRSCGYSCTATESRVCDLPSCPGEQENAENATLWTTLAKSETPAPESAHQDSCDRWLTCKSEFLSSYLQRVLTELPSCPCSYPSEAVYSSLMLRDEKLASSFRWRDASGGRERLDIYNPGAHFCLRSLLSRDSSSLGAQHCCYDHSLRLLTRGRAAGIPNLISADFSPELHYKADVMPWILCKGDWSRIHMLRPPNNGRGCPENPSEEEYLSQLQEAREF
ncbi:isthmin-2 [Pseudophryne corroboree]|uniref:isthmin-2 n=1 Tax=Pseudophryne corroboree TaxID=495146 RepID=UPI003081C8FE